MKPARWILFVVGSFLLLGAAGIAWWLMKTDDQSGDRDGRAPLRHGISDDAKSKRVATHGSTPSSLAALPDHLRVLILELHEQVLAMEEDGEITTAELVRADQWIQPRLEALGLEDLKLLMAFYEGPERALVAAGSYGPIADDLLFKRWGQIDPMGVQSCIQEDLTRTLGTLTKPIMIADAFVGDVEMKLGFEDYGSVFEGWATRDPRAALETWKTILATLADHPKIVEADQLNMDVLENISSGWSEGAPRDAWTYLRENLSELPYDWLSGFAWGLTDGAPWRELTEDFYASPNERLTMIAPRIAGRWACFEPLAAIDWTLESRPQSLDAMFNSWYNRGFGGGAFAWLQQNHTNLREEVRISSLRSAVRLEWERIEDVVPLLQALPRTEATWSFLLEIAQPPNPVAPGYDVGDSLTSEQLRSLVESLQPPEEIRRRIEAGLAAEREEPLPPLKSPPSPPPTSGSR